MKHKLLVFLAVLGSLNATSQSLDLQVVANSGSKMTASNGSIEYTVGELTTVTLNTSGTTLTQGFHQPEISILSINDYENNMSFSLYPNPTTQFVTVESSTDIDLSIEIYSLQGELISNSSMFKTQTTLDLTQLSSGSYILFIKSADGRPMHSNTVIKN